MPKKTVWDKLEKIKIKNKKKSIEAFLKIVKDVQTNVYNFQAGEIKEKDYVIVHETNRMDSFFIHVVPKETYKIFKDLQKKEPQSFLGFSILAGKLGDRDVRVSCFGIPQSDLTPALFRLG